LIEKKVAPTAALRRLFEVMTCEKRVPVYIVRFFGVEAVRWLPPM
jgi:hypothetical protein